MTSTPSEETAVVLVSRRRGRPTEYEPGFCTQVVDYFAEAPRTMDSRKSTFTAESGKLNRKEEVQRVCAEIPTFKRFARTVGISVTTLTAWRRRYPEFDEAYFQAKDIQKNLLIQNGLADLYAPEAFIFVAKNITDMTARTELTGAKGSASDPATVAEQPSLEHVSIEHLECALELMDQALLLIQAPLPETIRKEE